MLRIQPFTEIFAVFVFRMEDEAVQLLATYGTSLKLFIYFKILKF